MTMFRKRESGKMFRSLGLGIGLALGLASAAFGVTVTQTISYVFPAGGLYAGETIRWTTQYASPPPGTDIVYYNPPTVSTVAFRDINAVADSTQIIFSGSLDYLRPELYIYASVDPATNATGISHIEWWNGSFGIFVPGSSDIDTFNCNFVNSTPCSFTTTTSAVPLPPAGALLLVPVALGGWVARRRRRGSRGAGRETA